MRLDRLISLTLYGRKMEAVDPSRLLLEDGSYFLLEDGRRLLLNDPTMRPVPPNRFGEIELTKTTVEVWAARRILAGHIWQGGNQPGRSQSTGLTAEFCIRWREDVLAFGSKLTDEQGRAWRITSIRELDDSYGRERYLALLADRVGGIGTILPRP